MSEELIEAFSRLSNALNRAQSDAKPEDQNVYKEAEGLVDDAFILVQGLFSPTEESNE